tara:strand:+ start:14 stop:1438 length:1425 start_codon:yes stop_codon:yes gene_type:complete
MANRFPLVVDANDQNIKEIPDGDSLDFQGIAIANLNNLTLNGNLAANTATLSSTLTSVGISTSGPLSGTSANFTLNVDVAGNIDVDGTIDAGNFTVNGAALSTIQVKSDWNETNPNDPSFIQNKPVISGIDRLTDIPDVFANYPSDGSVTNKILKWDGFSWQGVDASTGGGIALTDLSVIINSASGNGTLSYNSGTGEFSFTPALVPTSTSQLTNDSNFITLTDVTNLNYITRSGISAGDPIAYDSNTGVISFDNTNTQFVTLAQVLLNVGIDEVLTAGNVTTQAVTFGTVNANGGSNSTITNAEITNLNIVTGITSTNGSFTTTNGNLVATNGDVTAGDVVSGNEVTATVRVNSPEVKNSGNISINAGDGNRVTVDNYLRVVPDSSRPSSPQTGDMHVTNDYLEIYSANADGQSNGGWLQMPCANGERGLQLPFFTTTERNSIPSPRAGELILNTTTSIVQIYNGTSWVDLGS